MGKILKFRNKNSLELFEKIPISKNKIIKIVKDTGDSEIQAFSLCLIVDGYAYIYEECQKNNELELIGALSILVNNLESKIRE